MALNIDAVVWPMKPQLSSISKTPQLWNIFKALDREINQPRRSQEVLLFLSTSPNFWVRKYGADSLVNETFENVHSLPSSRVTQRCPSSNVVRHGVSSPTSPPCPRPVAVPLPFWGAAWESPTARGSGGGVLPRRLELQCWVLPLHLQGQSRLQTIRWTVTFLTNCREQI